ncbi:MAG: glycosyltransferase family 39 protein [Planctomycetota bacterium]
MPLEPTPSTRVDANAPWAGWRGALALIVLVLLARVVFLVFAGHELSADEAQYWDWSRRLELSYYTKPPGIAWVIGATTALFGDGAFGVRLGAPLFGALFMLASARLAVDLSRNERSAVYGAAAPLLVPIFQATGLLITIDAPLLALWCVGLLASLRFVRAIEESGNVRDTLAWGALTGAALGAGALFKYTALFLLVSVLLCVLTRVRRWNAPAWSVLAALVAMLGAIALTLTPVIVWNAQHDWASLAHLLHHVGIETPDALAPPAHVPVYDAPPWAYDPSWTLTFIGSQLGLVGSALALMIAGFRSTRPILTPQIDEPTGPSPSPASTKRRVRGAGLALMLYAALPILLVYLGVSLLSDAEGNWPIAGYISLLALAAAVAPSELDRHRALVEEWRTIEPNDKGKRPRMGYLRRAPETLFQISWHWSIGYASVAAIALVALPILDRVPSIDPHVPMHRLRGHTDRAMVLHKLAEELRESTGAEPFYVTNHYAKTALMAYHLPGEPNVYDGAFRLHASESSYAFFDDQDLTDPSLLGRPAILYGGEIGHWQRSFRFDAVTPIDIETDLARLHPIYIGINYCGATP